MSDEHTPAKGRRVPKPPADEPEEAPGPFVPKSEIDARWARAKADNLKRHEETVAKAPIYAKQIGDVVFFDELQIGKDASGEPRVVCTRAEMPADEFAATFRRIPDRHHYYERR